MATDWSISSRLWMWGGRQDTTPTTGGWVRMVNSRSGSILGIHPAQWGEAEEALLMPW